MPASKTCHFSSLVRLWSDVAFLPTVLPASMADISDPVGMEASMPNAAAKWPLGGTAAV